MLITRKAEFSASHRTVRQDWPEAKNAEVYGESANPHGHGHNYLLEVTLEGEPDPVTGMVVDLKELKEIIRRRVIEPFDHRFLNHEVPPFDRVVPTAENIAREIWKRLEPEIGGGARLHRVRLWETEDLYVEYRGEAA
jgi:6-pyruvoyltetrahydropterin/6-carboxytetrahydropterin synthase